MADVAAKREARRRRILENSENRINRLLGKPQTLADASPSKEHEDKTIPDTLPLSAELTGTTKLSPTEKTPPAYESCVTSTSASIQPRPPLSSVRDFNASALPSHQEETLYSAEETKNLLLILEKVRISGCCLLGFLVRWVLSSGYGIFYFQSIFLPFILMEIGVYSFHYTFMKTVILPSTNSLLSGALMLCGIKQDLIVIYNRVMGYATAVTEDFALYLFFFIVYNAVIA